jgi:peptide/nickel transport system permease protein
MSRPPEKLEAGAGALSMDLAAAPPADDVAVAQPGAAQAPPHRPGRLAQFWAQYRTNGTAVAGLVIVLIALGVALLAPWLAPYSPYALIGQPLESPSRAHLMGTDQLGRDMLSILTYGTRISLAFGLGVALISLVMGILLGSIPGYFGGVVDDLFSRFFEIFLVIPQFILIITVVALFGNNIVYTMIVVGLTLWPSNAKIARAQVLTLKKRTYVKAARASGASDMRILVRHILPNGLYPLIANSTLQMAYAILLEASLSFLGLGDPNHPSWGQLLAAGNLRRAAWWLWLFSGVAILFLVLGFNLVGDGIQTALNPRQRQRQQA